MTSALQQVQKQLAEMSNTLGQVIKQEEQAFQRQSKGQTSQCLPSTARKVLGWTVDLVERPRKPAPEEVLKSCAGEWSKEGEKVDWHKLMPPRGLRVLPLVAGVVERTFSWIEHNRRMIKGYERLTGTSEALSTWR